MSPRHASWLYSFISINNVSAKRPLEVATQPVCFTFVIAGVKIDTGRIQCCNVVVSSCTIFKFIAHGNLLRVRLKSDIESCRIVRKFPNACIDRTLQTRRHALIQLPNFRSPALSPTVITFSRDIPSLVYRQEMKKYSPKKQCNFFHLKIVVYLIFIFFLPTMYKPFRNAFRASDLFLDLKINFPSML